MTLKDKDPKQFAEVKEKFREEIETRIWEYLYLETGMETDDDRSEAIARKMSEAVLKAVEKEEQNGKM